MSFVFENKCISLECVTVFKLKLVQIVHPTWVGCAFQNWERQKETDHPLTEESSANDADADFLKLSPGPRR